MTSKLGLPACFACFIPAVLALLGCTRDDFGTRVEDAIVSSEIKAKLASARLVDSYEIDVNAEDGIVRLRGTVESKAARAEAEELARSTEGARRVINEIVITEIGLGEAGSHRAHGDAMSTTKVTAKLAAELDLNPFATIDIDSHQGVVTLSGRVTSEETRARAERLARQVDGVLEVRNLLQVGDAGSHGESGEAEILLFART